MPRLTAEVNVHEFLTLALMERRAKNLCPGRLNAIGRARGTYLVGGLGTPECEQCKAVFFNRRAAARYRALISINTGPREVLLEFVILVF